MVESLVIGAVCFVAGCLLGLLIRGNPGSVKITERSIKGSIAELKQLRELNIGATELASRTIDEIKNSRDKLEECRGIIEAIYETKQDGNDIY